MDAANLPRISVIVPVRNGAATIEKALQSAISQDYPGMELLVLDAGSSDGTQGIVRRFESHIAFFRSHPDDGVGSACNEGIEKATGDIVAILGADDWYEPGILHEVGEAFAQDPSLDAVTFEAKVWKADAQGELQLMTHFTGKSLQLTPLGTPMPNARFYKKEVFTRHGGFMTRNHLGQRMIAMDLEMLIRLSGHGLKNREVARTAYHYLMHPGSLTFGGDGTRDRQMYHERAYIAKLHLDAPRLAPYRARLKRWHRRGTARDFFWQWREGKRDAAMQRAREGLAVSGPRWLLEMLRVGLTRRF